MGVQYNEVTVNPTIDTAAFATGDQIGTLMTFDLLISPTIGSKLVGVRIVDQAKQSAVLDLVLYNRPVTLVGAENAAADVSDADVAAGYMGHVNILAADYVALNVNSMAFKACAIPLLNKGVRLNQVVIPRHRVYGQLISRGSPDYDATSLFVTLCVESDES